MSADTCIGCGSQVSFEGTALCDGCMAKGKGLPLSAPSPRVVNAIAARRVPDTPPRRGDYLSDALHEDAVWKWRLARDAQRAAKSVPAATSMTAKESPAAPQTLTDVLMSIRSTAYSALPSKEISAIFRLADDALNAPALPVTILTDERIEEIAHRKCTSYEHVPKDLGIKYQFAPHHMRDFASALLASSASLEPQQEHVSASPDSVGHMRPFGASAGQQEITRLLRACRKAVVALAHAADDPNYKEAYDELSDAIAEHVEQTTLPPGTGGYTKPSSAIPSVGAVPVADRNAVLLTSLYSGLHEILGATNDKNVVYVAGKLIDEIDAAKSATPPATAEQSGMPGVALFKWPNGCDRTIIKALKYLAEKPRPSGGESPYNSEHLHQLAGEMERAVASIAGIAQPVAPHGTDEPTEREALIACLGDEAETLARINPDDEMAQTMREAASMLEADEVEMAILGLAASTAPVAVSELLKELRDEYMGIIGSAYCQCDLNEELLARIDAALATPTGQSNQTKGE